MEENKDRIGRIEDLLYDYWPSDVAGVESAAWHLAKLFDQWSGHDAGTDVREWHADFSFTTDAETADKLYELMLDALAKWTTDPSGFMSATAANGPGTDANYQPTTSSSQPGSSSHEPPTPCGKQYIHDPHDDCDGSKVRATTDEPGTEPMVKPGSQTSSVTGPIYLTPAHDTSHDAPSSFPLAEHGGIRSCARNDIHGPHEYDAMPSHKDEFMHWSCPGLRGSEAKIFPMEEVMASDGPATGKPPGHDVASADNSGTTDG